MAKNIKPASSYAKPHTMAGKTVSVEADQKKIQKSGNPMSELNISVGAISKGNPAKINPYGVGEMRGYGAATKGRKISGKQG